jgi:hypothetical protein
MTPLGDDTAQQQTVRPLEVAFVNIIVLIGVKMQAAKNAHEKIADVRCAAKL